MAHVLIIEDEPDLAERVRMLLEMEGYEVSQAANGKEGLQQLEGSTLLDVILLEGHEVRGVYSGQAAIAAARELQPKIYLVDIAMPRMSGYHLARAVRERYGRFPVLVAITGASGFSDKMAATLAGFDHHLVKPYVPRRLTDLLRAIAEASPRQ